MQIPDDDSETPFQINIVPMIDVVFAILTFFIMSTLYLTHSEGLPVTLPSATTAESRIPEDINVTIDINGDIFLNRQPIALQDLEGAVQSLVGSKSQILVVINADEQVTHGKVVSVMDRLRQVAGVKLAIAVKKV
jgi:biopolymer transport protein ExbD